MDTVTTRSRDWNDFVFWSWRVCCASDQSIWTKGLYDTACLMRWNQTQRVFMSQCQSSKTMLTPHLWARWCVLMCVRIVRLLFQSVYYAAWLPCCSDPDGYTQLKTDDLLHFRPPVVFSHHFTLSQSEILQSVIKEHKQIEKQNECSAIPGVSSAGGRT